MDIKDYLKELLNTLNSKEFIVECIKCGDLEDIGGIVHQIRSAVETIRDAMVLIEQPYYLGDYTMSEENFDKYMEAFSKEFGINIKTELHEDNNTYKTKCGGTPIGIDFVKRTAESPVSKIYVEIWSKNCSQVPVYGFSTLHDIFEWIADGSLIDRLG